MKYLQIRSLMSLLLVVMFVVLSLPSKHVEAASPLPPRWERLGARKVNFRLERDEIRVTARDGRFSAVKLKVTGAPLNMRRMVIHFGNGEKQEVLLKKNFRAGGESRVIDLKGGKRVIKKVVFWYDSKNRARRRATVQLWGRH